MAQWAEMPVAKAESSHLIARPHEKGLLRLSWVSTHRLLCAYIPPTLINKYNESLIRTYGRSMI